jgi:hypothetical protein
LFQGIYELQLRTRQAEKTFQNDFPFSVSSDIRFLRLNGIRGISTLPTTLENISSLVLECCDFDRIESFPLNLEELAIRCCTKLESLPSLDNIYDVTLEYNNKLKYFKLSMGCKTYCFDFDQPSLTQSWECTNLLSNILFSRSLASPAITEMLLNWN